MFEPRWFAPQELSAHPKRDFAPACTRWIASGSQWPSDQTATLAGIHAHTRRYSLEGLSTDRVSPTDIVVIECDAYGVKTRYHHTFHTHADETYHVHFPQDFRKIHEASSAASHGMMLPAELILPELHRAPFQEQVLGLAPHMAISPQPMHLNQPMPSQETGFDPGQLSQPTTAAVMSDHFPSGRV